MNSEKKGTELTVEKCVTEHPDIYKKVLEAGIAKGRENERNLLMETVGLCGDDLGLAIQCYREGKTAMETLQARNKKLQAALLELQQEGI